MLVHVTCEKDYIILNAKGESTRQHYSVFTLVKSNHSHFYEEIFLNYHHNDCVIK